GVPGVGLGLSIVRQLLEGMGTELSLDMEPESPGEKQESQGSRFSFVLELSLVHEEDVGQSFMESHATHVEGAGRRILVTDDLAMNRDELADLLGGYGFDVVTAPDGEAAWEKLQAGPFDLLLTDQMMPRMDGWQLLA
ncbi:ATP-binding response regulator, partial [Leptospira sp. SA-E8]|uniref:response regulator n=1 Tax=Leptospira sp. SA-E8 TaxID=3422259 RepID=UPI003EB6B331